MKSRRQFGCYYGSGPVKFDVQDTLFCVIFIKGGKEASPLPEKQTIYFIKST